MKRYILAFIISLSLFPGMAFCAENQSSEVINVLKTASVTISSLVFIKAAVTTLSTLSHELGHAALIKLFGGGPVDIHLGKNILNPEEIPKPLIKIFNVHVHSFFSSGVSCVDQASFEDKFKNIAIYAAGPIAGFLVSVYFAQYAYKKSKQYLDEQKFNNIALIKVFNSAVAYILFIQEAMSNIKNLIPMNQKNLPDNLLLDGYKIGLLLNVSPDRLKNYTAWFNILPSILNGCFGGYALIYPLYKIHKIFNLFYFD